jgi:predicted  nucleic acid-binding Zn-ribbon protein
MSEELKRLRTLQEIEQKRLRTLRDCQRIPREQQQRFNELEAARLKLERGREEAKRMKAEEKDLELQVKTKDERLEKLKIQANMAKDTSTLLATNHQIQTLKDENSKLEDRALGLVDRIAALEKEFDKQEKELERVRGEYAGFAQNCETELAKAKADLAAFDTERAAVSQALSPESLDMFNRLLQAREGLALCAVEGESCVGCGAVITANDLVRLRAAREIVRCKSCSRILFIET